VSDSMTATAVLDEPVTGAASIINDCTIHVATVNGSGSRSSNSVLMGSIFQMAYVDLANAYLQESHFDVAPQEGKLVIFPAFLKHQAMPYEGARAG
jgi:hypothetical protein